MELAKDDGASSSSTITRLPARCTASTFGTRIDVIEAANGMEALQRAFETSPTSS